VKYAAVIAGVSMVVLDALLRLALGVHIPLPTILWQCAGWLPWLLLAPVVGRVATAVPYRRGRRLRFFLLHGVAVLALSTAQTLLYALLRTLVLGAPGRPQEPLAETLVRWAPLHLILGLFVYGQILLATQIAAFLQAARKREEERLALERWLAQAELDLYKLQLPAGLVNERLLEIERTMTHDAERAELLIEQFGAFLRESLAAVNVHADVDEVAHDEDELEEDVPPALPLRLPLRLLLLFSITPTAHFVINAIGLGLTAVARNQPLAPIAAAVLRNNVQSSIVYFPVTLLMVWLGSRVRHVAVLVAVAVALSFAWHAGLVTATGGVQQVRASLVPTGLLLDFLLTFGIALGALAHARYRAWRATAAEVAQLESRVLRTRAAILRLQLNPHFLFNTLNSVAALLEDDPAAAAKMAAQLRQFVVRVLESSGSGQVPLGEELDSLEEYVAIENVRFDGRVELAIEASGDARDALVPGFLLQPLVENALRHGLLPETGGRVSVLASVQDGTLHIAVDDNGRANEADAPAREGLGLSNTRARLAQAYGDGFFLDIASRKTGFGVAMEIPYRSAASEQSLSTALSPRGGERARG
jgi:hypothetical protein